MPLHYPLDAVCTAELRGARPCAACSHPIKLPGKKIETFHLWCFGTRTESETARPSSALPPGCRGCRPGSARPAAARPPGGGPARAKLRKHTKRKRSRRSRRHTKRHTKRPPQRLASLALRWRHTHACVIFESVSALRFPRARALGANARLVHAWQGTLFWAASLLLRVVLEQVGGEELDRVGRPVRCKIRSVRSVRCQVSGVRCEYGGVRYTPGVKVRIRIGRLEGPRFRVHTRVCAGLMGGARVRGEGQGARRGGQCGRVRVGEAAMQVRHARARGRVRASGLGANGHGRWGVLGEEMGGWTGGVACDARARHLSLTSADRPCSSTGTTVLSR